VDCRKIDFSWIRGILISCFGTIHKHYNEFTVLMFTEFYWYYSLNQRESPNSQYYILCFFKSILTRQYLNWYGPVFVIAPASCGSLGAVSHTTNVPTGIYYTDTITYTCVSGYEHTSGNLIRTCQASRNWNGSPPVCSKYSEVSKNWNGISPVCSKYSQSSKNWKGSPLCVVSIINLVITGMVVLIVW